MENITTFTFESTALSKTQRGRFQPLNIILVVHRNGQIVHDNRVTYPHSVVLTTYRLAMTLRRTLRFSLYMDFDEFRSRENPALFNTFRLDI